MEHKTDKLHFKASIDRIEGDQAVLVLADGKVQFTFPVNLLPKDPKEGITIDFSLEADQLVSDEKKSRIVSLLDKLKGE